MFGNLQPHLYCKMRSQLPPELSGNAGNGERRHCLLQAIIHPIY